MTATEMLKAGGKIIYAPISGNLAIITSDLRLEGLDITEFLNLRKQGVIEHTSTMRQGHLIFRGRVDSYELATERSR